MCCVCVSATLTPFLRSDCARGMALTPPVVLSCPCVSGLGMGLSRQALPRDKDID